MNKMNNFTKFLVIGAVAVGCTFGALGTAHVVSAIKDDVTVSHQLMVSPYTAAEAKLNENNAPNQLSYPSSYQAGATGEAKEVVFEGKVIGTIARAERSTTYTSFLDPEGIMEVFQKLQNSKEGTDLAVIKRIPERLGYSQKEIKEGEYKFIREREDKPATDFVFSDVEKLLEVASRLNEKNDYALKIENSKPAMIVASKTDFGNKVAKFREISHPQAKTENSLSMN